MALCNNTTAASSGVNTQSSESCFVRKRSGAKLTGALALLQVGAVSVLRLELNRAPAPDRRGVLGVETFLGRCYLFGRRLEAATEPVALGFGSQASGIGLNRQTGAQK